MNPLLFNSYMTDIEERKSREIGGVRIGRIRIWNLVYVNDLVLLAKNRKAMQDMMLSFKEFLGF